MSVVEVTVTPPSHDALYQSVKSLSFASTAFTALFVGTAARAGVLPTLFLSTSPSGAGKAVPNV